MKNPKTKERIYVCHTYYHVYVALLKEMKLVRDTPADQYTKADVVISTLSTDFDNLAVKISQSKVFKDVYTMIEKRETAFPEIMKYKVDTGNIVKNMINRMIFTKKLAKASSRTMDSVGFEEYKDIYVFCDSDPIGYYLNYKHIYYHAVEDGLDCLKNFDQAYVDNYSHFKLKAWFAKHNLIFIMNGWSKYCIDMEVNDISAVPGECPNLKEVPRKPLENELTFNQKDKILKIFIDDFNNLRKTLTFTDKNCKYAMYLSEGYPRDNELKKQICLDILEQECQGYKVIIKPHPMDTVDYTELCPDAIVLKGKFPIEVLNFIQNIHIDKGISVVSTAMKSMNFIENKVNLGVSFWDKYEEPEKHQFNKKIGFTMEDA